MKREINFGDVLETPFHGFQLLRKSQKDVLTSLIKRIKIENGWRDAAHVVERGFHSYKFSLLTCLLSSGHLPTGVLQRRHCNR